MNNHIISHETLTIERVKEIIDKGLRIELGHQAEEAVVKCRRFLDTKMEDMELLPDSGHSATSRFLRRTCHSFSTIS